MARKKDVESTVQEIHRKTRKKYPAEKKIHIVPVCYRMTARDMYPNSSRTSCITRRSSILAVHCINRWHKAGSNAKTARWRISWSWKITIHLGSWSLKSLLLWSTNITKLSRIPGQFGPSDVYLGREKEVLSKREQIKQRTLRERHLWNPQKPASA